MSLIFFDLLDENFLFKFNKKERKFFYSFGFIIIVVVDAGNKLISGKIIWDFLKNRTSLMLLLTVLLVSCNPSSFFRQYIFSDPDGSNAYPYDTLPASSNQL